MMNELPLIDIPVFVRSRSIGKNEEFNIFINYTQFLYRKTRK